MRRSLPIVLVLMMLLATACQKGAPVRSVQSPSQTQALPDTPPEVITLDLGVDSRHVYAPIINQLVTAFERTHPEYRVNKVELPPSGSDRQQIMEEELRAGKYDIVPYGWFDRNLLEPLDPYLSASMPAMEKVAEASEHMRIAGRLRVLPLWRVPEGFIINRELWEAAGVPLPEPGWSWDELRTAVARLTQGDGETRVWGLETPFHEFLFAAWLMQKAGPKYWLADEQDLREGLRFFTGLAVTDQSIPAPPQRDWGTGTVSLAETDLFRDRRAAITYGAVYQIPFMNQRYRFSWDILPVPARPGGKPTVRVVSTVGYGIAASSEQKDAAWAFLKFALGPEGAAIVAATGAIPTDGADVTWETWGAMQPAPPAGMRHLLDSPWVSDGVKEGPAAKLINELFRLTNLCLRGELDPDTAVTQYVAFRKQWVAE